VMPLLLDGYGCHPNSMINFSVSRNGVRQKTNDLAMFTTYLLRGCNFTFAS
jgi:hypothetical protein